MYAAVVGDPVAHSLSPRLHQAAYRHLGLTDWRYGRECVPAGGFAAFMQQLPKDRWAGLSVTMPHKRAAAQWATSRSELVQNLGVANTLIPDSAGWQAHNTDVAGIVACVQQCPRPVTSVLIFGAGATAQSALVAAAEVGATQVTVLVRDTARATAMSALAARYQVALRLADDASIITQRPELLISTVPHEPAFGWWEQLQRHRAWSAAAITGLTVLDVVYDPWPSPLSAAAHRCGGYVIDGVQMLLHQALAQITLMTGFTVPASVLQASLTARSHLPRR